MTFPASTRQGLDLASLLNEEQLRAATHPGGPLLIVAGAGSGKTRTLVHRVAWLVDRGIDPASILLVTFTRKAASEMLARCASLVGDRAGRVSGGTFHSLANSILRRWAHLLGYSPSFTILDQDDSEAIIGRLRTAEIGEGAGKSTFPKKSTILGLISKSVNCGRPLSAVIKSAYPHLAEYAPRFEKIRSQYQAIKKENDQMDFDDLLVNLEAVMTADESVRQLIAGRYRHVLVDEYQDTNPVQARLTHLLGRDHQNVTAVGDEAQSIYSFRGADYTNILAFSSIFPGAAVIKLEDNYRSRPEVLSVANHLLGKAKSGFNKVLRPNRESGPKPKIILCDNLGEEAEEVVDRIGTLTGKGAALSDIAVLFRNGSHSFELEAALARARIPFSKFGGRKFLELAHVKDYLSLLRLSIRPTDPLSLSRVLSLLSGLGNKSVSLLLEFVAKRGENYRRLDQAKGPSIRVKSALREFSDTLIALNSDALSDAEKAALAHKWYSALIPSVYPDDQNHRQQDVDEILGMALSAPSLVAFLSDLALDPPNTLEVGGEAAGKRRDDLTLSTVHSAKGLEWPYVFVISAVDGRFPSPYLRTEAEAEEELRLMYVAVTRAKDELTITVPLGSSLDNGGGSIPSRFLSGLSGRSVDLYSMGSLVSDDRPLSCGEEQESDPDDYDESQQFDPGDYDESQERPGAFGQNLNNKRPRQEKPPPHPLMRPIVKDKPPKPLEPGPEPKVGQMVKHTFYGLGRVLKIADGSAVIDFQYSGRKSVRIAFAKLTLLDD